MAASSSPHKRHKPSSSSSSSWRSGTKQPQEQDKDEGEALLLPGLPDHLAQLCLSHLPPPLLFSVSSSWRRLLYSPSFTPFLSLYVLLTSDSDSNSDHSGIEFASFDPISSIWTQLPPPPPHTHNPILLRHPSFISRQLPVQTASVAGRLLLLAGTDRRLLPALPRPLVFDPSSSAGWLLGPTLPSPRRWCAAASAAGRLYVVSGLGSDFSSDTARSAERWDPEGSTGAGWEPICPLKDSRFSREPVDMVCSDRGRKLCMVNVKTKEGAAYDVESDRWEDVPPGLISGWTGPAAGTDDGGPIYVVDEGVGMVRRYDWDCKKWTVVIVSEKLKGAASIALGGGRICIGCNGGGTILVVDDDDDDDGRRRRRSWELSPPAGKRVMAMHVLPRMTRPGPGG